MNIEILLIRRELIEKEISIVRQGIEDIKNRRNMQIIISFLLFLWILIPFEFYFYNKRIQSLEQQMSVSIIDLENTVFKIKKIIEREQHEKETKLKKEFIKWLNENQNNF